MADLEFVIRTMTRYDLEQAIDWAAEEGWNPGLHDAEAFLAADPNGFLVGIADGEPVSCISVVRYGAAFAFLGFYIVRSDYRGHGLGMKTWQAGMAHAGTRNVGLDGVVAQQDNYRKSGFQYAYANQRYEGRGGGTIPAGLTELRQVTFPALANYDARLFGAPRESFLRRWIDLPESQGLAVVRDGAIAGYGVVRTCRSGCKIGPLFADDAEIAERIFCGLAARAQERPLYLDIPRPNTAALDLARRHRMNPVFETARMYTQGDPGIPVGRVFGVTTFELG